MQQNEITAPDVMAIREGSTMDQSTFARVLGVSERTVRGWETGATIPASAQFTLRLVRHCQAYGPTGDTVWRKGLWQLIGKPDA